MAQPDYEDNQDNPVDHETPDEERERRERQKQSAAPPATPSSAPPPAPPTDPYANLPSHISRGWAEDFIRRNPGDYSRISSAYGSGQTGGGSGAGSGGSAPQTSGGGNSGGGDGWQGILDQVTNQNQFYQEMVRTEQARLAEERARQAALEAERKAKADQLYSTLMSRSQQGLNIPTRDQLQPNDPNANIYQQVDLFDATQQRAHRDYLSDLAEASGPLYNMRGEQRMLAETGGQNVANFQADLIGRELQTRRDEIAQALAAQAGMLSADQVAGMQRELAGYDQAIRLQQSQLGGMDSEIRRGLGMGSLANELQRMMLQNQQFGADLGLRTRTQDDYYDLVRRGRLGNAI